jgi:hypothetical protein
VRAKLNLSQTEGSAFRREQQSRRFATSALHDRSAILFGVSFDMRFVPELLDVDAPLLREFTIGIEQRLGYDIGCHA